MTRRGASRNVAPPDDILEPQIRLVGEVNATMVERLVRGLAEAAAAPAIIIEVTTSGGDAELGRRLALEVRLARDRRKPRLVFLGKTQVYSAGVTLMSAFPRDDRYLTHDTTLLIHGRQLDQTIEISGPLHSSQAKLKGVLAQIDVGLELERQDFTALIEGSDIGLDELQERAVNNWYLTAAEAEKRGLVAGLV